MRLQRPTDPGVPRGDTGHFAPRIPLLRRALPFLTSLPPMAGYAWAGWAGLALGTGATLLVIGLVAAGVDR